MPLPVRSNLILPAALLEGEPGEEEPDLEETEDFVMPAIDMFENRSMRSFKSDPFGRDSSKYVGPKKDEWSLAPLANYMDTITAKIDDNIAKDMPFTDAKFDSFVSRVVSTIRRRTQHAPREMRRRISAILDKKFRKFWNVQRNQKVKNTTPQELKIALVSVIEAFQSEFAMYFVTVATLGQPKACRPLPYP